MREAVKALVEYDGPAYMRLGRLAVETVTDEIPGYKFELGRAAALREGSDLTICATGLMVQRALAAAELLAGEGVSARVLDFHTIKPLDGEALLAAARSPRLTASWVAPAVEAVHRNATAEATAEATTEATATATADGASTPVAPDTK